MILSSTTYPDRTGWTFKDGGGFVTLSVYGSLTPSRARVLAEEIVEEADRAERQLERARVALAIDDATRGDERL